MMMMCKLWYTLYACSLQVYLQLTVFSFLSCRNHHDMNEWIEAINLVAATYSAPPLPAPVGSWYNKLSCSFYD